MSDKSTTGSTHSSLKRSSDTSKNEQQPVKKKINMAFGPSLALKKKNVVPTKKSAMATSGLTMKLASKQEKSSSEVKVVAKSKKAAAVFNESSDSEPEEMPLEARMRMKNIGRNTPTSAGPNSFNKGKLGFIDNQKSWEMQQEELLSKIKDKKAAD